MPCLADLLGKLGGDLFAVDGLDAVEQRHRLLRLVGLQRADQVQFDVGEFLLQRRPFALRFLHAVFAEDALAGLDDRTDVGGLEGLRDGDQRHRARLALRLGGRRDDRLTDGLELFDGLVHACPGTRYNACRQPQS